MASTIEIVKMENYIRDLISFIMHKAEKLDLQCHFQMIRIVAVTLYLILIRSSFCISLSIRDIDIIKQEVYERIHQNPLIQKLFLKNKTEYRDEELATTFEQFFIIIMVDLAIIITSQVQHRDIVQFIENFAEQDFLSTHATFKMMQDDYYIYVLLGFPIFKDYIEEAYISGMSAYFLSQKIAKERNISLTDAVQLFKE